MSRSLSDSQQQSIQNLHLEAPFAMSKQRRRSRTSFRSLHRSLRRSHRRPSASRQGFYWPAIIDDIAKLVATCEACQKFSHRSKAPTQSSIFNCSILASVMMGHWHSRQAHPSTGQLYIRHCGGWVFHQHNLRNYQKILLAKHYLSLRCPTTNHGRQCQVLWQWHVQGFSPSGWNKGRLRIRIPPTIKRSSRKSQRLNIRSNQENPQMREERQMDRSNA
jgi:hypothetical protein